MSDPTPTSRSPWPYVVALLICIAGFLGAFAVEVFGPSTQVDHANEKIAHALSAIVADPYGAGAAALAIVTFLGILWSGWKTALHTPVPTKSAPAPVRVESSRSSTGGYASISTMLFVVLAALFGAAGCALLLPGCAGLTPLQVGSVSVTVSLRALSAAQDAYDADIERRMSACPADEAHDACVHAARDVDAETVLDSLDVVIRGIGAGIAIAAEVDAGGAIPDAILHSIRDALGLYDRIETILLARGVPVPPEIGVVVHALEALVGTEEAPAVADLRRVREQLLDVYRAVS